MSHSKSVPSQARALPSDHQVETVVVAFLDFSPIPQWASSEQDLEVAGFFQAFYAMAADRLTPAGGRIVKFMGDAALAICPTESAEEVIFALCALAGEGRQLAGAHGFDTYLNVSVHAGPVVSGSFGPGGSERFDVIGKTVNIAARLGRRGVRLSAQAFRCLSDEGRKRFDKITRPVTYSFRS